MQNLYKRIFGLDFQISDAITDGLPIYMTIGRSYFMLSYDDVKFLLVSLSKDERFGIVALEKQIIKLVDKYGVPVAFGFDAVTKLQRDKLLERNIPFITDNGQLYLPFLGMMLSNTFKKDYSVKKDKMMPITQALFLYLLYKGDGKPIMKKEAAERLGVTKTSITRASEQLVEMELISQEMRGKEHYMRVEATGMELYKKAKPYLINPIQQVLTIEENDNYKGYLLSGESALARRTMLNDPAIPVYAVYKANIDINDYTQIDPKWMPESKPICVELWKYDPTLFASSQTVDPVSLALCFENSEDERIEGAIEEYMEEYVW